MSFVCSVHGKIRTLSNLEEDNKGGYRCKTDSFCQSGGSIGSRKRPPSFGDVTDAPSSKRANTPCKFFAKGICEKGESCPFSHESPGLSGAGGGMLGKGIGKEAKGGYDNGYGWDEGMTKGGYGKMDMMGKGKPDWKGDSDSWKGDSWKGDSWKGDGYMKGGYGKMGDDWAKGGWDSWNGADWGKGKGYWDDGGWGKGDMGKMGAKGKESMMGKGPAWHDWDYGDSWNMSWSPTAWKGGWSSIDSWTEPAKGSKGMPGKDGSMERRKGMPGKDGGMEIEGKSACSLHNKYRRPEFLVRDPRTGCLVCAEGYECKAATPGTLCKFYAEGKCERGLACQFSHGEDEWAVQIQTTAKGQKAICQVHGKARKPEYLTTDRESGLVCCLPGKECKDATPGVMCKFFLEGKCTRGEECQFSHGQPEAEEWSEGQEQEEWGE